METRLQQLSELRSYITRVDKEVTLALQTLQWDTHRLLDDSSQKQSRPNRDAERTSMLARGYEDTEMLFPDTVHDYGTVVKLSPSDVSQIIKAAAEKDSAFKMGGTDAALRPTPQSYDRLISTFTPDERRAIYDAVVCRATTASAALDLTLTCDDSNNTTRPKSNLEILAELRDMKRRRTKYKVATKSKNYSQVLREVIKNEMEIYTGIKQEEYNPVPHTSTHPHGQIKQERFSPERELTEIKREPGSPPPERRRQNETKAYHRQNKTRDYYTQERSKEHHRSETRNYDKHYEHRDRHRQDSNREHSRRYHRDHSTQDRGDRDYMKDESRSNRKHKQSKRDVSASRDYERESRRVTYPNDKDSYDGRKKIKIEDCSSREMVNNDRYFGRKPEEKRHRESDEDHRRYDSVRDYDKHVKEEYESDSHSSKEDRYKSKTHRSYHEGKRDKK